MDRIPPEAEPLDTRDAVAGKGRRKRRKRTTAAGTLRRINAKARERQAAWAATGQRNVTERLTGELRELEDKRQAHRSQTGESRGDPYKGATDSKMRQWVSENPR